MYIVHNAARASHIPGVGTFGSGFLTDPAELSTKLRKHEIVMVDMI